jgi:hypothetical protein
MRVTEVMLAGMAKVEKGVRHWVAATRHLSARRVSGEY